ncbi:MAG: PIN domain-containing protein [Trueperaceae bacterium]|nr:PIN domain-containing protein [Trueperaceae bacterium]
MQHCFVDSNVWLYALIASQDADKSRVAEELIRNETLMISTQIVNEVCVNLIRKSSVSETDLRKLVASFYRRCTVVTLKESIFLSASHLRGAYRFSFWDSIVVASALSGGADVLYTEDMQHGLVVEGQLRLSNPFL